MLATYETTRNEVHAVMAKQPTQLRPDLEQVVEKIQGLKDLTESTGFLTYKTVTAILKALSPEDASVVGRALRQREAQKQPPIAQK